MLITSYTLKIKELNDSLGYINVNIDEDEMVQIWQNKDDRPRKGESSLLRSLVDVVGRRKACLKKGNKSEGQMLYSNSEGGRGCHHGRRGWFDFDYR